MDIISPEDRVVLWRSMIDAEGAQREALLHVIAKEVASSLSALDLYDESYAQLTIDTLQTLDDAGLAARDSFRRCLEVVHEPEGGVELLVAEMAALLRDAAGVDHLGVDRRVRAVEMAGEWREHVLGRGRPAPEVVSVADVAARYGVTTQAVYKWLRDGRIEGEQTPGGSWRIPAAQFDTTSKPAAASKEIDALKSHLLRLHEGTDLPSEDELTATMRDESH